MAQLHAHSRIRRRFHVWRWWRLPWLVCDIWSQCTAVSADEPRDVTALVNVDNAIAELTPIIATKFRFRDLPGRTRSNRASEMTSPAKDTFLSCHANRTKNCARDRRTELPPCILSGDLNSPRPAGLINIVIGAAFIGRQNVGRIVRKEENPLPYTSGKLGLEPVSLFHLLRQT